jgi:hypothetical protein
MVSSFPLSADVVSLPPAAAELPAAVVASPPLLEPQPVTKAAAVRTAKQHLTKFAFLIEKPPFLSFIIIRNT